MKAHNNHAKNDRADELAKARALSDNPCEWLPIPDAHIKELIDVETRRRWNHRWALTEGHRQTMHFFPEVDCAKAMKLFKIPKSRFSQAIRWITGFNGLAYQNNKISPQDFPSPNCQLCNTCVNETSVHLIGR